MSALRWWLAMLAGLLGLRTSPSAYCSRDQWGTRAAEDWRNHLASPIDNGTLAEPDTSCQTKQDSVSGTSHLPALCRNNADEFNS